MLGLTHLYTFGTFAFFDCAGVRLFLSQAEAQTPLTDSTIYLKVDHVQEAYEELRGRGVDFQHVEILGPWTTDADPHASKGLV